MPGSGEDSTPDEFAHLFRPDDEPDVLDEAPPLLESPPAASDLLAEDSWEPLVPIPTAGSPEAVSPPDPPLPPPVAPEEEVIAEVEDGGVAGSAEIVDVEEVEQVEEVEAAPLADPAVGRLFRSRGGPEVAEAVTAVGSLQARRLRTLKGSDEPVEVSAPPSPPEAEFEDVSVLPVAASGEPAPALQVMSQPVASPTSAPSRRPDRREDREDSDRERRPAGGSGTLTGLGVYAVTIGVTVILAFGETLFFGGQPGLITGIGLFVVSVFAAFAVRTRDGLNAIFAPPIAFFVAAITAGQVGLNVSGLTNRGIEVFFLLGDNWVWIVGSTVAALVIVALRRRIG